MNQNSSIFVIAISGGSGSGKTSLSNLLSNMLPHPSSIFSQDSYYKDLSHLSMDERNQINFDHPNSIDFDRMIEDLTQLKNNNIIQMPVYNFKKHNRDGYTFLQPNPIIIVEGILILSYAPLAKLFDYIVFIDVPEDILVLRRLRRDLDERGRTFDYFVKQYYEQTRPMYHEFVKPFRQFSDLVVDGTRPKTDIAQNVLTNLNHYLS